MNANSKSARVASTRPISIVSAPADVLGDVVNKVNVLRFNQVSNGLPPMRAVDDPNRATEFAAGMLSAIPSTSPLPDEAIASWARVLIELAENSRAAASSAVPILALSRTSSSLEPAS